MTVFDFPQLSPEWFEARKGVPTASQFGRILTPKTGKLAAAADEYIFELIAEIHRLGPPSEVERLAGMSLAMRHGVECEPEARSFYELERGADVRQVGFILSDCGRFGCSPDGLIGEDGLLELKCPQGKTQVRYLVEGGLPDEYRGQVHGSLIVTGRPWIDFMSYCPGLPPLLARVTPDDYTAKLADALEAFWDRLSAIKALLAGREVAA